MIFANQKLREDKIVVTELTSYFHEILHDKHIDLRTVILL